MMKKIVKIAAFFMCLTTLVLCLCALFLLYKIQNSVDYVNFDKTRLTEVCSEMKILDKDGCEIKDAICINDKRQIPLSALHDYTSRAFLAVEDKRFFSHNGVDLKRIFGAIFHNVRSGNFKEGASTISQQLIKNTHLDNTKSIKRKVNEMLLALELERNYSKNEILEMYLNTIYFGRKAYGIENAANVYFNKSAADLTIAESALLAGMIKAPNNYAPDKNIEKCKKRRDLVLGLMREQNIIDQNQLNEALNEEIVYIPYRAVSEKTYVSQVIDEACNVLNMTQSQLFHSGFIIETYFDKDVQEILTTNAQRDANTNKNGTLCDLACVICDREGGIAACYFRGESALNKKQIGSTAKPIAVYTPALCEKLITQASPVLDEPTNFGGYTPSNAGSYMGWTTVKTAVAKSLNIPAVKTLNCLGVRTSQKYLEKLGFYGEQNLSLALGNIAGGMNAVQLANCYATLANGGVNNGTGYIRAIYGQDEIYKRTLKNERVFDENSTYLMTDMLLNAVNTGTAKALANNKFQIAAKTGTVGNSNGNQEALVAGYTTTHTFVFWYSGDMRNEINGGTAPCTLAFSVMNKIYENVIPTKFSCPENIVEIRIDKNALYQKQQIKPASNNNVECFLFEKNNAPKVKSGSNTDNNFDNIKNTIDADNNEHTDEKKIRMRYRMTTIIKILTKMTIILGGILGFCLFLDKRRILCESYYSAKSKITE